VQFRFISFYINASSESHAYTCGQAVDMAKVTGRHVREGEHAHQKEGDEQEKDQCV